MAGMLFAGNPIFTSIGVGAMIMVGVAMVGSLTVLPALMAKLGTRMDRGRVPVIGKRAGRESRVWSAVLTPVLRYPWIAAGVSAAALVALALPTLTMHTKLPSFTDLPRSLSIVESYDRIQQAFPGAQTPAVVVVRARDVEARPVQRALIDMELRALASGEMYQPMHMQINARQTVATVSIPLAGAGEDDRSKSALHTLRQDIIPATVADVPGVEVAVTGQTAGSFDFNDAMKARVPIVFAFVMALAFVLLLLTFRSIVIPIKAIVLNLLSVAAAYGVLVLVFQNEWAEGLLGFNSNGAIASWLPLFLFVLLFGLSMDYHIFIVSRIKELVDRGVPTADAVSQGIRATAGTVTSAAIVMVAVFAIFASLSSLDIKQMGVGLAAAVLIDATIIRAVLLPASMKVLGKWNWYLPRWLDWLPNLSPEGAAHEPQTAVAHQSPAVRHAEAVASTAAGAPDDQRIEVLSHADRTDVRVYGELTHDTSAELGRRLREAEASAPTTLVIDLRELRFMDSMGLSELVRAQHRARDAGCRLIIVKREGPIERILAISGLAEELETANDVPPNKTA
jgi:RND superfamily putative drug exporter